MKKRIEKTGDLIIVHLEGEMTDQSFHQLGRDLLVLIADGPRLMALDFEDVNQMDLAALGQLIGFSRHLILQETDLILYGLKSSFIDLMSISGTDKLFNILTLEQFEALYRK